MVVSTPALRSLASADVDFAVGPTFTFYGSDLSWISDTFPISNSDEHYVCGFLAGAIVQLGPHQLFPEDTVMFVARLSLDGEVVW